MATAVRRTSLSITLYLSFLSSRSCSYIRRYVFNQYSCKNVVMLNIKLINWRWKPHLARNIHFIILLVTCRGVASCISCHPHNVRTIQSHTQMTRPSTPKISPSFWIFWLKFFKRFSRALHATFLANVTFLNLSSIMLTFRNLASYI